MKRANSKKIVLYLISVLTVVLAGTFLLISSYKSSKPLVKHRLQWWLKDIGWDDNRTKETGKGIRIAIIDSGIDNTHPDLQGKIEKEYRVKGLGEGENTVFHGTAVAGIIAGYPSNEKGILGVAVNSRIISVDVTDQENGRIKVEHLIEGIDYAIGEKVDIINISAGVKTDSKELRDAIDRAYNAGIVVIAASGNYMENDLLYPAKYDQVLAVGAYGKTKKVISPKGNIKKKVVYLPGENIVTAGNNSGYTGISGTSGAVPIASGIVALMKEKNKKLTNEEIITYFNQYAHDYVDVKTCLKLK